MSKAYWIGHVSVDDANAHEAYREANAEALANFGGRFLVRGGPQEIVEGKLRPRSVVIAFPSLQAARDCYYSPEYQRAKALRDPVSLVDLVIVEGWDDDSQ